MKFWKEVNSIHWKELKNAVRKMSVLFNFVREVCVKYLVFIKSLDINVLLEKSLILMVLKRELLIEKLLGKRKQLLLLKNMLV